MAKEVPKRRRGIDVDEMRVVDDFTADRPITPAELDAIEAYLGPLLSGILNGPKNRFDSEPPQISAR
jgi:hypothetical protein